MGKKKIELNKEKCKSHYRVTNLREITMIGKCKNISISKSLIEGQDEDYCTEEILQIEPH